MLPAKPFYLIRHGQSTANVRNMTAGGLFDSDLSPLGHEQGRTLSPYLAQLDLKPTHLYHSPMIRARDTALYLNETLGLPTTVHRDLREQEMGIWDGLPWLDVLPMLEAKKVPPGGESEQVFAQRIRSILTHVVNDCPGLPMVVAHGGLFHAIGFMYEYAMSHVNNCHLHYFEPYPAYAPFPWRSWMFDIEGNRLVRKPALFCCTQTVERLTG
jgi:probable phosphoglycerate mutase